MASFPPGKEVDREPLPLRPLPDLPISQHRRLPISLSSIVGREREIASVEHLLRDPHVRLVTLTGAAGAGKTRLALRVAEDLANDFRDGVVLVELAPVRDPDLVAKTVAEALGVTERVGQSPAVSVRTYLKDRSLLLAARQLRAPVAGRATRRGVAFSLRRAFRPGHEPSGVASQRRARCRRDPAGCSGPRKPLVP